MFLTSSRFLFWIFFLLYFWLPKSFDLSKWTLLCWPFWHSLIFSRILFLSLILSHSYSHSIPIFFSFLYLHPFLLFPFFLLFLSINFFIRNHLELVSPMQMAPEVIIPFWLMEVLKFVLFAIFWKLIFCFVSYFRGFQQSLPCRRWTYLTWNEERRLFWYHFILVLFGLYNYHNFFLFFFLLIFRYLSSQSKWMGHLFICRC